LSKRELADNELKDDYAERLQRLAEKKLKSGEDVVEAKVSKASDEDVDEEDDEVDLLETIRRSLHARNGNGRSRPKAKSRRKRA
jgi:non-homologous end joining protein Ku